MRLILTHEQADFDAVASQLAAHLLDDAALPVLSRRTNRNVRAFLTLYQAELPFVEARSLPAEPIQSVMLVDTQSLTTLKGMPAHLPVHVVDHHHLREDLPAGWTVTGARLGACTTLLVEDLIEHNGLISPIHATLMLIGIYEDTGSLTYISTTARDVHAAAYLLEQGANLHLLAEYLNPPLSDEQRQLYDRLLAAAQSYTIHGQTIVIACGDGIGMSEEVSSVAHKLRDLLEPHALFLLVTTDEGLRLVARATTDQVNVAVVAAHFGGGGHERAAAALIRRPGDSQHQPSLAQIQTELLDLLPKTIRPPVVVAQIMSKKPRLIQKDTPASDVAVLIQRYGHEGYPVVDGHKIIGLLSRRAVDRALAHKLTRTAAHLMDAGDYSVTPQDSIETLQKVMTDSGWGQIPVVDPADGHVMGIVTRTDLLKLLLTPTSLPGRLNLASNLESAMPPARLALLKAVSAHARQLHLALYIVGGFVRDLLLERPGLDFDMVVEGDAIRLAQTLCADLGGHITTHARFGTARWDVAAILPQLAEQLAPGAGLNPADLPDSLDLISARTEFYEYPTALPTVERSSIKLDLHRRDFTINTLALRLDGSHYGDLYDYWAGLNDLRNGILRVLHSLSFVDDPTRMLRAVRFEQRFGFTIEPHTLQRMTEARPLVKHVSGERLCHELDLLLAEARPAAMLSRLHELHLLEAISPGLGWSGQRAALVEAVLFGPLDPLWPLPRHVGRLSPCIALAYILWLSELAPADGLAAAELLRLPNPIHLALQQLPRVLAQMDELDQLPPSLASAWLDEISELAIAAAALLRPPADVLRRYVTQWRHISAITNGNDLLALGLTPGPGFRTLLNRLRSAWLDGEIHTAAEEQALLASLLVSPPAPEEQ